MFSGHRWGGVCQWFSPSFKKKTTRVFRIGKFPKPPTRRGEIRLDLLEGDLAIAIRVQHIEGLFLFLHLEETFVDGRRNSPPREKNDKKQTKQQQTCENIYEKKDQESTERKWP